MPLNLSIISKKGRSRYVQLMQILVKSHKFAIVRRTVTVMDMITIFKKCGLNNGFRRILFCEFPGKDR